MAEAMLKAGVIQKKDIEAAERKELLERKALEVKELQATTKLKPELQDPKVREAFRRHARESVVMAVSRVLGEQYGSPDDTDEVKERLEFVEKYTELEIDCLERDQ
jgi:hypothetical protein